MSRYRKKAIDVEEPLVDALEITLETLERCRRDETLTYEEKKAGEEHARKALATYQDATQEDGR